MKMRVFYSSLSLALALQFGTSFAALAGDQGPQIEKGEVVTNARVVCGGPDQGDFRTAPDTVSHALPYNGGPTGAENSNGQWTGCHAVTVAEYRDNPPYAGQWSGTLMIAQNLGGRCNPSGTGGVGSGQPAWHSTINLPSAGPEKTWRVTGTVDAVQDDTIPSAPPPCELSISRADGGPSFSFTRPSTDRKFTFENLKPGVHQIALTCQGEVSGGCIDGAHEERNERQPAITVNFVMDAK